MDLASLIRQHHQLPSKNVGRGIFGLSSYMIKQHTLAITQNTLISQLENALYECELQQARECPEEALLASSPLFHTVHGSCTGRWFLRLTNATLIYFFRGLMALQMDNWYGMYDTLRLMRPGGNHKD